MTDRIYDFENGTKDDIKLTITPEGHLTITIDFLDKVFTEEQALRFATLCGYKLKRAPLKLVK